MEGGGGRGENYNLFFWLSRGGFVTAALDTRAGGIGFAFTHSLAFFSPIIIAAYQLSIYLGIYLSQRSHTRSSSAVQCRSSRQSSIVKGPTRVLIKLLRHDCYDPSKGGDITSVNSY
jgi:hypothetical protein